MVRIQNNSVEINALGLCICFTISAYENEDRLLWDPSKIDDAKGNSVLISSSLLLVGLNGPAQEFFVLLSYI